VTWGLKQLKYEGQEAWQRPEVDPKDPRVITVLADNWAHGHCHVLPVARVTDQSATSVTIAVSMYDSGCTTEANGLVMARVTLTTPLGSRTLRDANADDAVRPLASGTP
jgi:hypothetical protein